MAIRHGRLRRMKAAPPSMSPKARPKPVAVRGDATRPPVAPPPRLAPGWLTNASNPKIRKPLRVRAAKGERKRRACIVSQAPALDACSASLGHAHPVRKAQAMYHQNVGLRKVVAYTVSQPRARASATPKPTKPTKASQSSSLPQPKFLAAAPHGLAHVSVLALCPPRH